MKGLCPWSAVMRMRHRDFKATRRLGLNAVMSSGARRTVAPVFDDPIWSSTALKTAATTSRLSSSRALKSPWPPSPRSPFRNRRRVRVPSAAFWFNLALSVLASSWSRKTVSATSGSLGSSPRKMAPRAWLVTVGSGERAGRPHTWPSASGRMPNGNELSCDKE